MHDDVPLGTFEEQVLLAVLRTGDAAYGMSVRREIEDVTDREISVGATYATLDRLEAKKLVSSRRATVDGVSRRLFAVTGPADRHSLSRGRCASDCGKALR